LAEATVFTVFFSKGQQAELLQQSQPLTTNGALLAAVHEHLAHSQPVPQHEQAALAALAFNSVASALTPARVKNAAPTNPSM
jgi:hypothetical protein